ncbi:beta strand repeat-containing protein [Dongia sedimenti]|uniref:Ig-like domain-containing protein n=1 Tax=Dongia sedimenti TaxID=3064282 RepID=A0ABU0YQU8_9PROT|nr:Ig-like domain-containing protein [Rhodospirillaceae bacterium R-7]
METDLIFETGTSDSMIGEDMGNTQLAAAPSASAPFDDALARPFDAAQVVIPQGENIVRIPVAPGEVVELPFPPDAQFLARIDNGNLAIKVGDVTVILQGYVEAAGQAAPVVEASNGQPLDIATILASTDPNIDIQTAAGPAAGPQGQGADNTGAFFQAFGQGAGLGGFTGVGALDGTEGLGGGTVDQTGTLFVQFGLLTNTAPTAEDLTVTTDEDHATSGQLPATDADGDTLTYSAVGVLPAGVTLNPDGSFSFDPAGNYEALNAGNTDTVTFQYKANDGTVDSNTATVTIQILGVNDAPVIGGTGDTLNYTENDAPKVIDSSVTVSDVDSANFNGGSLTVSFTANGTSADQLSVLNQGNGAGQIGVAGSNITYEGVVIGTFSGGVNGAALVITFNSDTATPAAIRALIQDIAYANSSDNPSTADRTVTYTLVDGDGTALGGTDTGTGTATVHVTAVNDAPFLLPLTLTNYTEDQTKSVELSTLHAVQDPDSTVFTWHVDGALPAGVTLGSDGKLDLKLDGNYDYLKAGETKTVSFQYHVNDGTADSNVQTLKVQIQGVNDAPVIGNMGGTLNYTENEAPKAIDSSVTVSDVDSANFNGGSLKVSFTANGTATDQLSVLNEGNGAGQIGVSGSDISYGGVVIGTVSGGANGTDLIITFNSDTATPAAIAALIQHIAYANSSDDPSTADRTVAFTLVDGDGTALGGTDTAIATATVHVTAVNDAPFLLPLTLTNYTEDQTKSVELSNLHAIQDPDSTVFTWHVNGALPAGVTLGTDGKLDLNLAGNYDYLKAGETKTISFQYHVNDGTSNSNVQTLSIQIKGVNDAPVTVDDTIITNVGASGTFIIPEWSLLANDTDKEGQAIDVANVSDPTGTGVLVHTSGAGDNGAVSVQDDATLGGSFKYTATDGADFGNAATVTFVSQAGGDLTGTAAHEILVSGAAGDKIDGKGGNDLIFGGDGDDTVLFHNGDTVVGGGDSIANSNDLRDAATRGDVLAIDHDVNFVNLNLTHSGGIETISTAAADGGAGAQSITLGAATVTGLSDHTITPGGVFTSEKDAVRIDGDAVDQLYLSISKDGGGTGWADTGIDVNGYHVFAHETTAGNAATADAYVMVSTAIPTANVHLNQDQP